MTSQAAKNYTISESVLGILTAMNECHARIGQDLAVAKEYIETGSSQNSIVRTLMASERPIKQMAALYDSLIALHQLAR